MKLTFIKNTEMFGVLRKMKVAFKKTDKTEMKPTILRFATAFGLSQRMRFDLTISQFTRDLFFGKELLVFDENTWRPYCHVTDFAILIDRILNAPNKKVNLD